VLFRSPQNPKTPKPHIHHMSSLVLLFNMEPEKKPIEIKYLPKASKIVLQPLAQTEFDFNSTLIISYLRATLKDKAFKLKEELVIQVFGENHRFIVAEI